MTTEQAAPKKTKGNKKKEGGKRPTNDWPTPHTVSPPPLQPAEWSHWWPALPALRRHSGLKMGAGQPSSAI